MPRKTRMYLPGVPVHVVQRGNNRTACFFSDDDYLYYKAELAEGLRRYGAQLHAYCLMTSHVHLLMTPRYEDSISWVFQHVERQYVQYVNKTYAVLAHFGKVDTSAGWLTLTSTCSPVSATSK